MENRTFLRNAAISAACHGGLLFICFGTAFGEGMRDETSLTYVNALRATTALSFPILLLTFQWTQDLGPLTTLAFLLNSGLWGIGIAALVHAINRRERRRINRQTRL